MRGDMSLLDIARDSLKDLPISDILRERLSLALDLAKQEEAKHEETKAQLARTEAHLEQERLDHKQAREELQRLKDEHTEEVRIHSAIEFRRGSRTGRVWLAFCPKCHLPANVYADGTAIECSAECGWLAPLECSIERIVARF